MYPSYNQFRHASATRKSSPCYTCNVPGVHYKRDSLSWDLSLTCVTCSLTVWNNLDSVMAFNGLFSRFAPTDFSSLSYYIASSLSGQDDLNPALLLATRADKMALSCPLSITGVYCVLQENSVLFSLHSKYFIDQACLFKIAVLILASFFFACLWTLTLSWSVNTHKNKKTKKRTWPISSHLDPTSLANVHDIHSFFLVSIRSETLLSKLNDFLSSHHLSACQCITIIVRRINTYHED